MLFKNPVFFHKKPQVFQNPVLPKTSSFSKTTAFSKPRPFKNPVFFSKLRPFKTPSFFQKPQVFQNHGFFKNPGHFQTPRYKNSTFFKISVFLKFHSKVRPFSPNPGVFIKTHFSIKIHAV